MAFEKKEGPGLPTISIRDDEYIVSRSTGSDPAELPVQCPADVAHIVFTSETSDPITDVEAHFLLSHPDRARVKALSLANAAVPPRLLARLLDHYPKVQSLSLTRGAAQMNFVPLLVALRGRTLPYLDFSDNQLTSNQGMILLNELNRHHAGKILFLRLEKNCLDEKCKDRFLSTESDPMFGFQNPTSVLLDPPVDLASKPFLDTVYTSPLSLLAPTVVRGSFRADNPWNFQRRCFAFLALDLMGIPIPKEYLGEAALWRNDQRYKDLSPVLNHWITNPSQQIRDGEFIHDFSPLFIFSGMVFTLNSFCNPPYPHIRRFLKDFEDSILSYEKQSLDRFMPSVRTIWTIGESFLKISDPCSIEGPTLTPTEHALAQWLYSRYFAHEVMEEFRRLCSLITRCSADPDLILTLRDYGALQVRLIEERLSRSRAELEHMYSSSMDSSSSWVQAFRSPRSCVSLVAEWRKSFRVDVIVHQKQMDLRFQTRDFFFRGGTDSDCTALDMNPEATLSHIIALQRPVGLFYCGTQERFEEFFPSLCEWLQTGLLYKIHLANITLSPQQARSLCEAVVVFSRRGSKDLGLQEVQCDGCDFSNASLFFSMLAHAPLRTLILRAIRGFPADHTEALEAPITRRAMGPNTDSSPISFDSLNLLLSIFETHPELAELSVEHCGLAFPENDPRAKDRIAALCALVISCCAETLEHVHLEDLGLSPDCMSAPPLPRTTRLRSGLPFPEARQAAHDLCLNESFSLGSALAQCRQLHSLSLKGNRLYERGTSALLKSLVEHPTLHTLDICGVGHIGDASNLLLTWRSKDTNIDVDEEQLSRSARHRLMDPKTKDGYGHICLSAPPKKSAPAQTR